MAAKPADAQRCDGGFGAAGDHGVGIAALDDAEGIANGVRRGGAGGCGGFVGSARAVLDGDVAGSEVDDGAGDEEGRDLARATGEQVGVLALDDIESTDAGADVDADAVAIFFGDLEAGVGHRLGRRGQGEVDEAAHLAGLFLFHEEQRVKVLDLCGEADGWPVRSNAVISAIPLLPARRPSQTSGAVLPTPQIRPRPVTTTRRCSIVYLAFWFFSM